MGPDPRVPQQVPSKSQSNYLIFPFHFEVNNPIPVKLWNDINRRGWTIMARIEFCLINNDEDMLESKICCKKISLVI